VSDHAISYGSQPVVSQDCKEHPCPFFVSDHRGPARTLAPIADHSAPHSVTTWLGVAGGW
jgi:hypothetical protein